MDDSLQNSENYLQRKHLYIPDMKFATKHSQVRVHPRVTSGVGDSGSGSTSLGRSGEGSVSTRLNSPGKGSCPEDISDYRSSSQEREILELENGNISPMQEGSSTDEDSTDGSISQDDEQLTHSGDSSSDGDLGGDFTVSKYMQSKISRLDEARFGVWKVERMDNQTSTDPGVGVDPSGGSRVGTWEVAGPSHAAAGVPPLKLTLKKSLQGNEPDEQATGKISKKKHKTKRSPVEPEDPQKRRRPGRPPSNNPPSVSTRQRLMNMFRKKYFKDRKRWARTKSTGSMPPTIRSIAKP